MPKHGLLPRKRVLVAASLGALVWTLTAETAFARVVWVHSGADAGPGTFRAAVERANADVRVERILFGASLSVVLASPVVYTGPQDLEIDGNWGEVVGAADAPPSPTWDGGLFASRSAADVTLREISFRNSFNNGVGIFVPADATGVVRLTLRQVAIESSRFHGLFVDDQQTSGFDTDDVPHPDCVDPWPVESAAGLALDVSDAWILRNGTLAGGFDTGSPVPGEPALTGCPADFDGLRADDGGAGGITAHVRGSVVDLNLADGIECDERGEGGVRLTLIGTRVVGNGETGTVDLDDGVDVDEEGPGSLEAAFIDSDVSENRDEGLDLDEAGPGGAFVIVKRSAASGNEDQNVKVDEEGRGRLVAWIVDSVVDGSLSQHGIELSEADAGRLSAFLVDTTATGNDDAAVAGEQEAPGRGTIVSIGGDLSGNGDPSFDVENVDVAIFGTRADE